MKIGMAGAVAACAIAVGMLLGPGSASPISAPAARAADACPWMDTSLTPAQRARALLDASTLDQKLRWLDEQSANNPTQTAFSGGITMPAQVACTPVIQ